MNAVAVGHVTHDRCGDGLVPGGSAWYAARAWRAAGVAPRMVTAVGEDFVHDAALEGLGAEVQRGGRTTVFSNVYPADGGVRVQTAEAVAPEVRVPAGFEAELLLLAPVLGEVSVVAWRAAAARVRVAGLQGWIKRREGSRVLPRPERLDAALFAGIDAVCLSDEDLAGDHAWLQGLRAAVPVVALTLGREGCVVYAAHAARRIEVAPVDAPDPTGAGDTFAAMFALELARGASPEVAAQAGCEAARALVAASRA